MKFHILILVISSIFFLNSCSSKTEIMEEKKESSLDHLPSWIIDPNVDGYIAAVGIAPKSKGGLQFQIPKAEADARANIAAQINTEVSRLTKNSLRESQIEGINDVENVFSQATKNLIKKVPISGAKRINMHRDPIDGTLYIHMSLDSELVANYFTKNKAFMKASLENAALSTERLNQAQKAVDSLFNELNTELK